MTLAYYNDTTTLNYHYYYHYDGVIVRTTTAITTTSTATATSTFVIDDADTVTAPVFAPSSVSTFDVVVASISHSRGVIPCRRSRKSRSRPRRTLRSIPFQDQPTASDVTSRRRDARHRWIRSRATQSQSAEYQTFPRLNLDDAATLSERKVTPSTPPSHLFVYVFAIYVR